MSRTNRNFVIAYILLVGLPLAGLVGILKTGRGLTAPISVDGTWKLEANRSGLNPAPCTQAVASSLSNSSLVISQSGKSLVLAFNNAQKTNASGVLEGKNLSAPLMLESVSGTGCMASQPMTLIATVDPHSEPRSLAGSLAISDCPSCAPIEFHAVRLPRAKREGTH